jgi:peptidoglycan/LPS O-acetylase OafA/YrhL
MPDGDQQASPASHLRDGSQSDMRQAGPAATAPFQRTAQPPPSRGVAGARLLWLDALRGIAALCVVFDHLSRYVLQHARWDIYNYFDPGKYGVFVFFLVSGYIVPASLERKGSVRAFWVSRVFRLYPLYLFAIGAAIVLSMLGIDSLRAADQDPATAVLTQLLMLSNMLNGPNLPDVVWTLAFEMVFYLLITALFVCRVHRHSAVFASGFAVGAMVLGGVLPLAALSGSALGTRTVAVIADTALIAGLALAVVTGGRRLRVAGVLLAAATGMILLLFNTSYPYNWSGCTILALMFTGTMIYRAEHGQFSPRMAKAVTAGVFALVIAAGVWHSEAWHLSSAAEHRWQAEWFTSLALAGATFAAGMALRHRKVPAVLAWLGLISYSVYLLHPLLYDAYRAGPFASRPHPFPVQLALAAVFVAVLLGCCTLSYRLIEAPAQRLGRRLARSLSQDAARDPQSAARSGT